MANRTVKEAKSVRGTNPQFLIEKIIRSRIYECKFWKEECFALSAELIVDKAMELRFVGGVYGGNIKPSPFLCLTLKMLQIQPEKDIIVEFIKNEEFKYVRALGAFYMRLVGTSIECYKYLEPLLNDGRKLRVQVRDGSFQLLHMDDYIDCLLHEERQFDIILPRIQKRHVLEESNEIEARVSALEDDADENVESSEEDDVPPEKQARPERKRSPLRSKDNERKDKDKEKERKREKDRERDKRERREERRDERHRERTRSRSRSRSRERRHRSRTPERRTREGRERKEERTKRREHDRDRYERETRDDRRRDRDRDRK